MPTAGRISRVDQGMRIGILAAERSVELRRARDLVLDSDRCIGQLERSLDRHERTAAAVKGALQGDGHQIVTLRVDDHLLPRLRQARPDLVFDTYFGPARRQDQAYVASMLEYGGIPFTGGDAACQFIGLSKPVSKRIFTEAGLPTPRFFVVDDPSDAPGALDMSGLGFPLIVKTSAEGEGIGLDERSVVGSREELVELAARVTGSFHQPALVEEFMPGREFTVGVIDGLPPRVLPVLEIVLGADRVYSYQAKTTETAEDVCPAEIPADQAELMGSLAVRAGRAVGCRDYWRVDFRASKSGELRILEINTLPGLQPGYSDIVKMAGPAGLRYGDLVRAILDSASRRLPPRAATGALTAR